MEHDDIIQALTRIETKLDAHLEAHKETRKEGFNFLTAGLVPSLVSLFSSLAVLAWKHRS